MDTITSRSTARGPGRRTALIVACLCTVAAAFSFGCGTDTTSTSGPSPESGLSPEFPLGVVRVEVLPEFVTVQAGEAGWQPHAQLRVIDTGYELTVWPSEIDGITLEEGTSYVLDVEISEREEYLADASSVEFRLVEVIETNPAAAG